MHRAKHRAAGDTAVLATTLIERFAVVPGPRHSEVPVAAASGAAPSGAALFGDTPRPAPMLAVADDEGSAPRDAAELFDGSAEDDSADHAAAPRSPFGAARHAAVPGPRVPTFSLPSLTSLSLPLPSVRPQPVGAALSAAVLGAAAAVTAVAVPAPGVESAPTPVEAAAPVPAIGPVLVAPVAPAPLALPDGAAVQVNELVTEVTAQMQKVDRPYETVAHAEQLSSPAAMRKAAMSSALGKLGKPYRWGAMGPNAFDCSGLVKWSFANAGRSLPRTSRAMATMGVRVAKADLQPGDLVFFYQPISHVGIYIGNGKIVHASRRGQPVKVSDMSRMRFTTARRV